jgi:pimeloyl-ACP methyl ester carboxylesterase
LLVLPTAWTNIKQEEINMRNDSSQSIAIDNPAGDLSASINKPASAKVRPVPIIVMLFRFVFRVGGHFSPRIAGRFAYRLWFMPTRFNTPASEQKALSSAEIKHVQINNHNIATYSWEQSGPRVLLVHGWSGRGTQLGNFVEPLLEAGYRVLSFDAPAHGKSSGKQTNAYEVADTILALQHHYGTFAAVIAHSFGGPCVALAIQRGLVTKCLVSIAPPANTLWLVEKFISTLQIPAKVGSDLIRRIETTFGKSIWDDISMINTVKELKIPGLLIHDDHDSEVPWQEGNAVAQAWNNAEFIKTSGLGHRRILRDATVVETAVSFIDKNR